MRNCCKQCMIYTRNMKTARALFAAGCFWGVQYYFDQVPGVVRTTVGYTGGHTENPTYDEVCSHMTGHAEATLVEFDPSKVSYEVLVKQFFHMHDPTQLNRQGPDIGDEYRSAIFYFDEDQRRVAQEVLEDAEEITSGKIVTEITKAGTFYEAEPYHQKFSERTGIGMCHIPYEPMS
jgi:methionine-S-sulfoxide reductase